MASTDWFRAFRPRSTRPAAPRSGRKRRQAVAVSAAVERLEERVLLSACGCGASDQDPDYVPPPYVTLPPGNTIVDYYAEVGTYVFTAEATAKT